MGKTSKKKELTQQEQGAVFIAWYKDALKEFDGGLITRAQAANILGITNTAVERLIGRGHIRARYFPREPDIEQIQVGDEDPFWVRLLAHIGPMLAEPESVQWVQACYVSIDDVIKLWEKGDQKYKARVNWQAILEGMKPTLPRKKTKKKTR